MSILWSSLKLIFFTRLRMNTHIDLKLMISFFLFPLRRNFDIVQSILIKCLVQRWSITSK